MTARKSTGPSLGALFATSLLFLAAALLCVAGAGAQQEGGSSDGFTASERRQLASGRLVARRTVRRRGQRELIGGNAWQVVDQPTQVTWRALTDADHYGAMLPAAEEARVVAHSPGTRVVRISHAVGLIHARYHLRMQYDHERHDIAFRLDRQRPNDLRAAWGFLNVQPFEDDAERSLISYGVMADVGGGMLGGLVRGELHDWLLRVPETVRSYLHGSGRHRYR